MLGLCSAKTACRSRIVDRLSLEAPLVSHVVQHGDYHQGQGRRDENAEDERDREPVEDRVAEVPDPLAIGVDRDALGDEILLDHVDQVSPRHVFRMAATEQALGRKVRLPVQLRDARGDLIGVALLLVGVLPRE